MSRLSRRRALQGLGALVTAATISACRDDPDSDAGEGGTGTGTGSGDGDGDGDTGTGSDTGTGTDTGTDTGTETGTETGDEEYEVCEASELSPAELLSGIDHIVVVMMENRSFDHYLGGLSLAEGRPVDGLLGSEQNPTLMGDPVSVFNTSKWVHEEDPPHSWNACHAQFNMGANDGFVTEHEGKIGQDYAEVMGYYLREQLPVYHALVDEYALCDRWFASVMTSTFPNRFYLHCADSDGTQGNDMIEGVPSIFDQLADAGISHRYYYANLPFVLTYGVPGNAEHLASIAEFYTDAENGELPSFCIIDPILTAGPTIGNDDHPPADVREGQAFVALIYEALAASPQWDRCLLIVTYDEHGGFFDHVPPPTTVDPHPGFEQLGFRVPSIVIGPQVRAGCVNGTVFDHVSVAATVAARWGLDPLNERVAATADLSSCIDPDLIDNPRPPISLPKVTVPLSPIVHVPGVNFGGQVELAALVAKGQRGGDQGWIRASRETTELLRELMAKRSVVRFS
ncbi:Phospholipase C 2 precursor [Enhygromyxa salina]|uniref:phospholipase C n=1 Tax=Enhygromyxa salina TaxID=215803 RepID=A0A2S9XS07_9BACT|nr:alkaline phosphatase family protein [Enhygromyxa salina]PRP95647.1 Phospholipase C 2 precursor [Enhygromyxa salina]